MNASAVDLCLLDRAVELAREAEAAGNLPIGSVIALDGQVIAEGRNALLVPRYDPGRHAEREAIAAIPGELLPRAGEMTCYSTLEPCVMCAGTLLLYGIRRVFYGATDITGGAGPMLRHLPPHYELDTMTWIGPLRPEICDAFYLRTLQRFRELPCGGR